MKIINKIKKIFLELSTPEETELEKISGRMDVLSDKMKGCIDGMIKSNERTTKLIDDYLERTSK